MKCDILLVQPRTGSWDNLGARIPESLLGIASIPVKEGYNVTIIDQRVDKNWKEKLVDCLKDNPIIFATSSMTGPQINYALELSKFVKSYNSDIPVMWGGLHPTLAPHQTITNPYIDILTVGQGEETFAELVHTLEKHGNLMDIKGIVYKENGNIITNPPRPMTENLDDLPDLPYHLIDMKKYFGGDFRGRPSIILTTSRGCPYRCTFCIDPAVYNRGWKAYSAERVIEKMRHIIDTYGIKDFYFQDDNFGTDLFRVKKILKMIVEEFDDIAWGTLGIRADAVTRMDDELLDLLQKTGCRNIDIGVESGSQRIVELMKKDEKVEDFIKANKILSKYNIILKFSFVIGYPTETIEDISMSKKLALKLVKENKNAYTPFLTFCPYIGTEGMALAMQHGFKPPETLEEWANFHFDGWYNHSPSWLTKKMQKVIENINFTSYFANKNVKYKISTKLGKFFFDMYHPIAKLRFRHNIHYFPIERKIKEALIG